MKKIAKKMYNALGHILCFFSRLLFEIKVLFKPIDEKNILFVTHPDDDALFFHTLIKNKKPYVVLLTGGYSVKRAMEFKKMMAYYSVRYNMYTFNTNDTRMEKIENKIKKELSRGHFDNIYSHSTTGEYHHPMHCRVGESVKKVTDGKVKTTVSADELVKDENRLPQSEIDEKLKIFNTIYSSQIFVVEQYSDWVYYEKITE